jgi:3-phosphoshikimate 1-carboxyvinyltransferase
VKLNCSTSSQYLSALLLIAPCTQKGIEIHVTHGPVSKPYIDMTLEVMQRMGIDYDREAYRRFQVSGGQTYRHGSYGVEPDASQAGYFWAAAAVGGAAVKVTGLNGTSHQGDVGFVKVLEQMGCRVIEEPDGITVYGGPLTAVEVDMGNMPDLVPTLAIVAAFAEGMTVIRNVGHLKAKESDRLVAVTTELNKLGIEAQCSDTELSVRGGKLHAADIDTYDDHRIAMSFALAGLGTPGVRINNENCVAKSFPLFWQVFESLYQS